MQILARSLPIVTAVIALSCASLTPVYPSRPAASPGEPLADPSPSRVVVHTTITNAALRQALESKLPASGDGTVPLMGKPRRFSWKRDPLGLHFDRGRIGVDVHLVVTLELPVSRMEFPLDLRVLAEPVVTSGYATRLQSTEVTVSSTDSRVKLANVAAG